ncbi:glycosyltransferase [Stygiolobus caldivivus]|uniref:Glycosyltransferase 2-like domain-containing protein n=1 Tax=Stygiolobus caldivivus TaxID=2824673 RepID=A0A8D5ZCU4_9CREN|nr:glycosyltransferase family 2 protein [Stygiolobus caldivivus]BCU68743.1 hypothetical protein KN1_00400 [Stygiolobus caldivivus]
MDVTVGLPTYKNNGTTIGLLLNALTVQTYKKFSVLIVYKPSEGDKTEEVVRKYSGQLDIEIVHQTEGYFDEALNLLYSRANGDILITTDDDAVPSPSWVEDHVRLHEKYPEVGLLGPIMSSQSPASFFKRLYNKFMEPPLEPSFYEYSTYYAKTGILVGNPNIGKVSTPYVKSFSFMGVNMSVKREVYKDFRLLPMTLRGIGNEPFLALHTFRKGYVSANFHSCCNITHEERDSLSRPKSVSGIKERYAELMLSVYYLSKFYKLDLTRLSLDVKTKLAVWNLRKKSEQERAMIEGLRAGLRIALEAIKEGKDEKWIRSKLTELNYQRP